MPLYEYRCGECGHRFEILQRLGEGPEGLACPRCGARRLAKQFSTFASVGGTEGGADGPAVGAGAGCGPGGGFT